MAKARKVRRPSRDRQDPGPAPASRVLVGAVLFYVVVLSAMVAFDRYLFILKSLVLPVLLLAALLSGRLKRFVNDWAVFLGAVVFFDFCRGLAFSLMSHFELPMYLGYVLSWERWLCGGAVAPVVAQHLRAALAEPIWLDRFFVLVYSSHFVFFLLFGLLLWFVRREAFRVYAIAVVAAMYVGLIFYFLVPTIPPWMAANDFLVLPPIVQLVRSFYNVHLPELLAAFDTNPIAAMPSLHVALPAICALLGLRYLGRAGWLLVAYALTVCAAVIYLGEHYLVDVLAGWALALAVYAGLGRWESSAASSAPPAAAPPLLDRWEPRPIFASLLLVGAAVGFGQLSAGWMGPLPITRPFVQRELIGRSPLAHYYLGRIALEHDDFAQAEAELGHALGELSSPEQQQIIRPLLATAASREGDFPAVIAALEPLGADGVGARELVLLGNAYVETHQYDKGIGMLRQARRRFPADPEPLYWLTRYEHLRADSRS